MHERCTCAALAAASSTARLAHISFPIRSGASQLVPLLISPACTARPCGSQIDCPSSPCSLLMADSSDRPKSPRNAPLPSKRFVYSWHAIDSAQCIVACPPDSPPRLALKRTPRELRPQIRTAKQTKPNRVLMSSAIGPLAALRRPTSVKRKKKKTVPDMPPA